MPSGQFTEIPIVDLSAIDGRSALADEMREICHEVGFFRSSRTTASTRRSSGPCFDSMRTFFALPEADKAAHRQAQLARTSAGWERGRRRVDRQPPGHPRADRLWTEWPARDRDVEPPYLRLRRPEPVAPRRGRCRATASRPSSWFRELGRARRRLLRLLSVGLGLAPDHLSELLRRRADVARQAHPLPAHAGRRSRRQRPPRHRVPDRARRRHDARASRWRTPTATGSTCPSSPTRS